MDARAAFIRAGAFPPSLADLSSRVLAAARGAVALCAVQRRLQWNPPPSRTARAGPRTTRRAEIVRAAPTLTLPRGARSPMPARCARRGAPVERCSPPRRRRRGRAACSRASGFALCRISRLQDVAASDEILAPLAVNAAVASAVELPLEPLAASRAAAAACNSRPRAVGELVGLVRPIPCGQIASTRCPWRRAWTSSHCVLALGARAHDMRAGRRGAAAEREGSRRCKSQTSSPRLLDAACVARRLGATRCSAIPARFVADESGYRARSIVALAALTPTTELPATARSLRRLFAAELPPPAARWG